MKTSNLELLYILFVIAVSFFTGCAPSPTVPLHVEKNYIDTHVDTFTLLPIMDVRKDKTAASIDLEKHIKTPLIKHLASNGYSIIIADEVMRGTGTQPPPGEVAEMDVSELASLGPPDSQYLFIFFLEDLSTSAIVVAKTSKVEASAVIVDKQNKRYLWQDKCVESTGAGGLISGLLPIQGVVMEKCITTMSRSLPKR